MGASRHWRPAGQCRGKKRAGIEFARQSGERVHNHLLRVVQPSFRPPSEETAGVADEVLVRADGREISLREREASNDMKPCNLKPEAVRLD